MARKVLTDRTLKSLKPAASHYDVWDATVPGLGVRVSQTGRKTFVSSAGHALGDGIPPIGGKTRTPNVKPTKPVKPKSWSRTSVNAKAFTAITRNRASRSGLNPHRASILDHRAACEVPRKARFCALAGVGFATRLFAPAGRGPVAACPRWQTTATADGRTPRRGRQ